MSNPVFERIQSLVDSSDVVLFTPT